MSSMQPGRSRMILMLHCRKILSNTSISLLHELYSMLHRIYFDNVTVSLYNFIYNVYIYVVNEIMILFYALTFSSFLFWFTSHGVPPFTSIYHETTSHCADMVASDAMSQRQKPFVQRSACEQLSLFTAKDQKKKLQQIPSGYIDWKRSSKIYAMWKVQRLLSSSKSKFGIFPILEAHTSFVDSHWNRRHVQRRCLGALNPPSNRWERCSIHRSI